MPWVKTFDVEQALDKAMQVFWLHGYEATSVQDLLDAMGINRGSMYDTFGDKRSLFIAALQRYDSMYRRSQLAAIERGYTPKAGIKALFDGWIDTVLKDASRRGCFLTNTALGLAAHDPEIGAMVAASQKDIEAFFCRLVRRGQSAGEIPRNRDPARQSRSLLAALIGLLVLGRNRPEPALMHSIVGGAMASLS